MHPSASASGRIDVNPAILGGRPFIRDTRLFVEFLRGLLDSGWSASRILDVYQYLDEADLAELGRGSRKGT